MGASTRLVVADADGENAQTALTSNESIISPSWDPQWTPVGLCVV